MYPKPSLLYINPLGKFHGRGCLHNSTMGYIYEGNLTHSKKYYEDKGYIYEGDFLNGKRHGHGVEKY